MKTSELTGPALDWAVAKCERNTFAGEYPHLLALGFRPPKYSTDWSQGGPIIEREKIGIGQAWDRPVWLASEHNIEADVVEGPTPLIAAMRCFCRAKLGDEIEIPQELQPCQQPKT